MVGLVCLLAVQIPKIITVTPGSGADYKEPQLAVENDGHVYIAYGAGNAVYISVSKDGGESFSNPITVSQMGKLSLGMRRGPRIAAHNGVVTISATYGLQGKGQDGDLFAFRSSDHGTTWSKGVRINDVEGAGREGLHAMGVAPDGTLACTWLDLRSKGTKLYSSVSKDGGASWAKNVLVYESPSGSICECCHPSLVFDSKGRMTIMFRNSLEGARDMYVTSSADGQTFSKAAKLGTGTWMLNACPMDGGMVAIGEKGIESVWRRENQVYGCRDKSPESSMGLGKQPWVTVGPYGLHRIWTGDQGVVYAGPRANPNIVSPAGADPVIASSPDQKNVFGAWTNKGIQLARFAPSSWNL